MTKIYGFFLDTRSGFRDCFRLSPEDALALMRQHALDMIENEDEYCRPNKIQLEEFDLEQADANWIMRLINLGPMAALQNRRPIATFNLEELATATAYLPNNWFYEDD